MAVEEKNVLLQKDNNILYPITKTNNIIGLEDTGWIHLDLDPTTNGIEYFKERDIVPIQIRRIGKLVMLNGQIDVIKPLVKINDLWITYNLFMIPENFRTDYESKHTSTFIKIANINTGYEIPCYVYIGRTGQLNIQLYNEVPEGARAHLDKMWFI